MDKSLFERLCSNEHLQSAWEDVKAKKAGGGIDGASIATFEINLSNNLNKIREELTTGQWMPQPYLRVEIPKKKTEKRQLGMLTVKDKVVQQAIRLLLEPRCEKLFLNCSYGYRAARGAVSAVNRVATLCRKYPCGYAVSIDVDDFFNNVSLKILETRIKDVMPDDEICRLIMLCIKMGVVTKQMHWSDVEKGLHQGAVLSPVLANLYMHSFDQFVTARKSDYIRYADDFVSFTATEADAENLKREAEEYLKTRLDLGLNPPQIAPVSKGFDYLGLRFTDHTIQLSDKKKEDIVAHISEFYLTPSGLHHVSEKRWKGYLAYYGKVLSQPEMMLLDQELYKVLQKNIKVCWKKFSGSQVLAKALSGITFISNDFRYHNAVIKEQLVSYYLECKKMTPEEEKLQLNRKIVLQRKHEYRKMESAQSELVISKPGMALGLAKNRVTVKENGLLKLSVSIVNLKHITVLGQGVSISSNLLSFLLENKIPLDFFGPKGKHLGSFLSASSFQCTLWRSQAGASQEARDKLATLIIDGKLSNQLNLLKYFHKYHKTRTEEYQLRIDEMMAEVSLFKEFSKKKGYGGTDYIKCLTAFEAQGAQRYWAYIRSLLSDDEAGFEGRIQQGAKDLVNCMLNYGYAILYARVWQALLKAQLNPYDSVIHVRQEGKPTFVFDVMELFRAQVVDRVVISLVQKKEPVGVKDGMLTDEAKKLLITNISERLQKREKYRGEEMTMERIIGRQASEIADYYSDNERFLPYKAKW